MTTNERDKVLLERCGFSFEYPGFWSRSINRFDLTISDGPTREALGRWSVQIIQDGQYALGMNRDTVEEAITAALTFDVKA